MKTIKFATLFLSLSMILTANVALAKQTLEDAEKHQKETQSVLFQFGVLAASSAFLHKMAATNNWSGSTQSLLHAANVLWQSGRIFGRPVLSELGIKTLLASGSATVANNPLVQTKLVPMIPLVGPQLAKAGGHTVGIITVAAYEIIRTGYNSALDHMPASVQHMVRGE